MSRVEVRRILGEMWMGREWLHVLDSERVWMFGLEGVVDGLTAVTAGATLATDVGAQLAEAA